MANPQDITKETWEKARLVITKEELEEEFRVKRPAPNLTALHVNKSNGFVNRQIGGFLREVSPGCKSGKHRHNMEAIIMCVEGSGYTIIDGLKLEYTVGDTISVPAMLDHQHFNPDPNNRLLLFAVHTINLMSNIGSFVIEGGGDSAGKIDE